jgi:aryl-alcohol dehydrogenase-like predicted oxidoreductase
MHFGKKLILGGAQIGQEYGLVRKTSFEKVSGVQDLLTKTWAVGFEAIDTARTYGNSEKILGSLQWGGELHTKLDEYDNPLVSLGKSLEELGRDSVDLLYICHDATRVADVSREYWRPKFSELRGSSVAFGAAVYTDQLESPVLQLEEIEVIQVPFNILSPASISEKIKDYKMRGNKIYARSVFAQGTLFGATTEASGSSLRQALTAFGRVCRQVEIEPPELAFRWALGHSITDGLVLGVSRLDEVDSVSQWLETGPLEQPTLDYVEKCLEPYRHDIDPRNF